jgi:hypothetical protein
MTTSAPQRPWTLLENGLLIFERAAEEATPRRLLVSQLQLCAKRECECRDVMLRSIGLELGAG